MSRRVMALAGVAILFAGAMAWANQGTPDDTKALDKTLEGWAAAFNSHDAKELGKNNLVKSSIACSFHE